MIKSICSFVILVIALPVFGQHQIAITIDDLPLVSMNNSKANQKYVMDQLIAHLRSFDCPAVGFVNEGKLYDDSVLQEHRLDALKSWLSNGFELGNHGYSHLNYDRNDTSTYFADLLKGALISKPLSKSYDLPFRYYRHPYLHAGDTEEKEIALEKFLARHGYQEAPVTIDNGEWIFARAYDMALSDNDSVLAQKIGADYVTYMMEKSNWYVVKGKELLKRPLKHVLLLHANNINADYLDELLFALINDNYEFISLENALTDAAYQLNDHIAKPWGISWIHRWSRNMNVDKTFYHGEPKCPEYIQEYTGFSE